MIRVVIPFRDVSHELINTLFGGAMPGKVGYRAYGDAVEWVNHVGKPMPAWEDLPERIQDAWGKAARAVLELDASGDVPTGILEK